MLFWWLGAKGLRFWLFTLNIKGVAVTEEERWQKHDKARREGTLRNMKYKGYLGSQEYSVEDDCYFGTLQNIKDIIIYEGSTPHELRCMFCEAVNDYIETCKEIGKEPDKPAQL